MVQQEFENIAADLRQRIIAVARAYRLDADSAEDVAQDAMLKLWTIREKLNGTKAATALAVTIARHLSVDMLRKTRPVGLDKATPADSRFRQPDAMLESSENERWLDVQLELLPTKEYAVLHLRQVEHKSAGEIAAIVGISVASVPTLLARARRRLLEEMKRRG
ncbi:RNA polymerase sigma factor [Prevotella sp.]|uniref:RNA polymerase sigma factor n=1 Tax=Prevotella sp. TaxID=59823 RepID=UPI003FD6FC76